MSNEPQTKIAVIAHFMSMNLGDRYQGTGVLRRLLDSAPISAGCSIECINIFSGDESEPDSWSDVSQVDGGVVYNIRSKDICDYDYIIMPTGSLSHEARFIHVALDALRSDRLKRIFLWGGFSWTGDRAKIIDQEIDVLRPLFQDKRVSFLARTWTDLVTYSMIATQDNGLVGGDPILLYAAVAGHRRNRVIPPESKVPMIWNGNVVSSDAKDAFIQLKGIFSNNLSIDADQDNALVPYLDEASMDDLSTMEAFADRAPLWRGVVSSRLHGGIMAKRFNAQCPVLFVPPDFSAPFSGSQKFFASALTTYEQNAAIGYIDQAFNVDLIRRFVQTPEAFFNYEHEYHFLQYMLITENTMGKIVKIIKSTL